MAKNIPEAVPTAKSSSQKRVKLPKFAARYGEMAYERIADIAANSDSEKMRFDASKWLCEMAFGKSAGSAESDAQIGGVLKVELGGELKRWAK